VENAACCLGLSLVRKGFVCVDAIINNFNKLFPILILVLLLFVLLNRGHFPVATLRVFLFMQVPVHTNNSLELLLIILLSGKFLFLILLNGTATQ
jgi:hypothetical protein